MLKQVSPQFKNLQGDVFTQAVIVVKDAIVSKEEIKKYQMTLKRTTLENYETGEESDSGTEEVFSDVRYTAEYWMQIGNFQQGNRGYLLEGVGGEIEFTIDMDAEWCEKYNSIQGTETQKVTRLCELHLEQEVLPALREL